MKEKRVLRIIENMQKHNLKQMIVTSPAAIFYLTGKWIEPGERLLALYINVEGDKRLFINELFPIDKDEDLDLIIYNDIQDPINIMKDFVNRDQILGIDKNWPSHFLIKFMESNIAPGYVNSSPIVDRVRMIKDEEEIALMRENSKINDRVMSKLVALIAKDYDEKKICGILSELYEEEGASGFSFHPLIAYGKNAAEPHHDSDKSRLSTGDSVILDIGGRKDNYCSDMTRTVFYKELSDEAKNIYNIVLEANLKAIDKVKPGVRFCDIDRAARGLIENHGYGKYFTHRTGHNIGIEVHDFGDVSAVNEDIVQPGMIFSIEPGIYLPNKLGVRIEDLVLVTEQGVEVLNSYTKKLQVIE